MNEHHSLYEDNLLVQMIDDGEDLIGDSIYSKVELIGVRILASILESTLSLTETLWNIYSGP